MLFIKSFKNRKSQIRGGFGFKAFLFAMNGQKPDLKAAFFFRGHIFFGADHDMIQKFNTHQFTTFQLSVRLKRPADAAGRLPARNRS